MYERVVISLAEVYEGVGRVGKSVILVCKNAQGLTHAFHFFFVGGGGEGYHNNRLTFYSGGVPNSYNKVLCYEIKFSSSCVELPALN